MLTHHTATISRSVDDHGEILIVRSFNGLNALVDPIFQDVVVFVPNGRRARLVEFQFPSVGRFCGRDPEVVVSRICGGAVGFRFICHDLHVLLQELSEGQRVDVMPAADPAHAYAPVFRPLPVLSGAVAAQPVYACAAA